MGDRERLRLIYDGPGQSRLDKVLYALVSPLRETSRTQIQRWIEGGAVTVNGTVQSKAGQSIRPSSIIELMIPQPESDVIEAEDIPLSILYEDDQILVIDKQPNFVVHPGAGVRRGTLMHALASHFSGQRLSILPTRMGIVHRLDRDTTGVLVVCKTEESLRKINLQFSERTVRKVYSALVFMTPRGKQVVAREEHGEIDAPIGRHPKTRVKMAIVEGGRKAISRWFVKERFTYGALLDVELLTGRTHQIRVHLEHIKCPIVGDPLYGTFSGLPEMLKRAATEFGRQALHARELALIHPKTGEPMQWNAALPDDFKELLSSFRGV